MFCGGRPRRRATVQRKALVFAGRVSPAMTARIALDLPALADLVADDVRERDLTAADKAERSASPASAGANVAAE